MRMLCEPWYLMLILTLAVRLAVRAESCAVELSLVEEACGEGRQLLRLPETVPLTQPVKVLVAPKALKR